MAGDLMEPKLKLIAFKNVPSINLVMDVVEAGVIPICDDGLGHFLEFLQVVDDETAEEGGAVFEGGFVDDDLGALCLDALHDALDGALAEVVGIGLHGEAVDANHWSFKL